VKTGGIGEHLVTFPLEGQVPLGQIYTDGIRLLAERGWQLMEHSFDERNHAARADVWEMVNDEYPIADLRWTIDHVNTIEESTLERMKALGVSIRAHGWRYLNGTPENNGPPYRAILDSGIPVGAGFDGPQAAPINPWLHVYYMVTGMNSTGTLINDGQQLSREEAVRLYTAANGWFSFEEDALGSIEVGKFGDLVVLSDDVFDEDAVSDDEIKRIRSVLTTVGGRIVHGDPDGL
jgi:predicted amidohydrolase YtcJ